MPAPALSPTGRPSRLAALLLGAALLALAPKPRFGIKAGIKF